MVRVPDEEIWAVSSIGRGLSDYFDLFGNVVGKTAIRSTAQSFQELAESVSPQAVWGRRIEKVAEVILPSSFRIGLALDLKSGARRWG